MKSWHFLPLVCALVSCAAEPQTEPAKKQSLEQRLNEKNGYAQDSNGQWVPNNNRRSSFDGKGESPYFKGEYANKQYKAGDYTKKSWWGSEQTYSKNSYKGDTDGSRFMTSNRNSNKAARDGSRQARETNSAFGTSDYKTGNARETKKNAIANTSDAETDNRRDVYKAPSVVDWQSQRELSIQQSKSLLGN